MIDGENIIYHYIQKTLLTDDKLDEFTKKLIEHLIVDLSIWLPQELYREIPILLPFVVRDASCRRKSVVTGKDEWGFANERGFLRDDNSLIKGVVKSFKIHGNREKQYNNKKLSKGFVACHIWQKLLCNRSVRAVEYEKTNSFIPNLVWLPKQIAKLTDREGSYAQQLLQNISYNIYNQKHLNDFTKDIWLELERPNIKMDVDINTLNYFNIPNDWIDKRKKNLIKELNKIKQTINHQIIKGKVKCSVYLPTLYQNIKSSEIDEFIDWLNENLKILTQTRSGSLQHF